MQANSDLEESKPAPHGKNNDDDGMVNVHSKYCYLEPCAKALGFNFKGKTPVVYRKQHADDSMVDVRLKHCAIVSCAKKTSLNFQ